MRKTKVYFQYDKDCRMERSFNLRRFSLLLLSGLALFPTSSEADVSGYQKGRDVLKKSQTQQGRTISGVVKDPKGEPIIGANIRVKENSANGTITNTNGEFKIHNLQKGQHLVISYIGYASVEIPVESDNHLNITLREDTNLIDELVVVGYATQKKVNLTGSVASIDTKQLSERANTDILKSLQGTIPGVTVISRPGSAPSINFRGRGNLGTSSPLYVIDGVISNPGTFQNLDPNTIESVSFLKDAASSSIYGSRAAYGVVLVKTKEGKNGKMTISYSGIMGVKNPTYISKTVSSADYARLYNEAIKNSNPDAAVRYSDEQIKHFETGDKPDLYPNSQWFEELLNKNVLTSQNSVSVSGGDKVKFYLGLGYVKDHNFIPGNHVDRYNFTTNVTTDINKWLTARAGIKAMMKNTDYKNGNPALMEFLRVSPTFVGVHSDGTIGTIDGGVQASKANMKNNPYRALHDGSWSQFRAKSSTIDLGIDIKPIEDLVLTTGISYTYSDDKNKSYSASRPVLIDFITKSPIAGSDQQESKMDLNWREDTHLIANYLASYSRELGGHHFSTLLGASYEDINMKRIYGHRKIFPTNTLEDIAAGSTVPDNMYFGGNSNNAPGMSTYKLFSLFGRINYDYLGKYLAELNIRNDASSRFAAKYRKATFPSFSLGWRMSEEAFMKEISWINNFKFRGSYGTLGNINNVGNYDYLATYKVGGNYVFDGKIAEGIKENKPANEMLSWEKVAILDLGLDLDLFKNRLSVVADYYKKHTKDILLVPNIPNEIGLGNDSKPSQNIGEVMNKGFEAAISWRDEIGDFSYTVGTNFSYNHNEILNLGDSDPMIESYWIKKVGQAIGTFYGLKTDGLLTEEDIKSNNYISDGTEVQPGDIKYVDLNGDGKLDGNDRTYIGCDVPKWTYGVNVSLAYKGFDLSVFGQGVSGTKVRFGEEQAFAFFDDASPRKYHLNRWTTENPDPNAIYPRLYTRTDAHSKFNQKFSDFWLFESDYFRIKNITLGYTFNKSLIDKLGLSMLKVYLSAENYITLRKDHRMKDFDPESSSGRGVSALGEKTISLGVNLSL